MLDMVLGAGYTAVNKKELWYFCRPWFFYSEISVFIFDASISLWDDIMLTDF